MATTAAVQIPYADATPAELRAAILPEDVEQFDAGYRRALDAAAETLRLDELESFLAHWRLTARLVNHHGHDHWRGVLDRANRIMAGERFPTISGDEMKRLIAERLAAGR
ncbi:MAG: DUF6247 family protein [Pseudonocardiaceae bacterium]